MHDEWLYRHEEAQSNRKAQRRFLRDAWQNFRARVFRWTSALGVSVDSAPKAPVFIGPRCDQVSEPLLATWRAKASIRSQALRILIARRRSSAAARISAASVAREMTRPAAASIAT